MNAGALFNERIIMRKLCDAAMQQYLACPDGAGAVVGAAIDIGTGPLLDCEFVITVPALTAGQLPDGQTMTYEAVEGNAADLSDAQTLGIVFVQTGAAGAGAVGGAPRVAPGSKHKRYIGLRITNTGEADASGASAIVAAVY
jgi:hypothetical protein